jgi:bis(5'-adenosyl)-triphosphatase
MFFYLKAERPRFDNRVCRIAEARFYFHRRAREMIMHAQIAIGSGGLSGLTALYVVRRAASIRFRMASHHASQIQPEETYIFGSYKIKKQDVFLTTKLSYAFVNLRPVVPGHVLISPKRLVQRFTELTAEETSDLWLMAQRVGTKVEDHFKASSLTFAIQDGPEAGQTVPHVHIHILPRNVGDFERNDAIYDLIEDKEKELKEKLDLDKERMARTSDEMSKEADELRALF